MSSEMTVRIDQESASFIRRAAAWFVDVVAVVFIWFGSAVVAGIPGNRPEEGFDEPWDTIVEIIIMALPAYWFVYHWIANAIGTSIGKRMLSISIDPVLSAQSSIVRGLVRTIGEIIGAASLGLGYLWALWDSENRAWHDKLAGTRVVLGRIGPGERPRAATKYLEEPRPGVTAKNVRFACEPSSPAAGVRYVELRREGVRFEDERGLRGFRFEDVEGANVLPTGDVELQFKGHDPFGRPNDQVVRFTVHDRNPFLAELESRVKAATGKQLQVARAGA